MNGEGNQKFTITHDDMGLRGYPRGRKSFLALSAVTQKYVPTYLHLTCLADLLAIYLTLPPLNLP